MKKCKKIRVNCPKHGSVLLPSGDELSGIVARYCPLCVQEARHPQKRTDAPYPLQGTSPSVIPELNRGD